MEKATIAQLKNRLSAYLRLVREGKTVLVYDRNHAVARIDRLDHELGVDARLKRLESRGMVTRATRAVPLAILKSPSPKAEHSVLAGLLQERREGRCPSIGRCRACV